MPTAVIQTPIRFAPFKTGGKLRACEHQGILFLSTERVGELREAFHSARHTLPFRVAATVICSEHLQTSSDSAFRRHGLSSALENHQIGVYRWSGKAAIGCIPRPTGTFAGGLLSATSGEARAPESDIGEPEIGE